MPKEADCELELSTDDLEAFLEDGVEPPDLGSALESMLEIAKKNGSASCNFIVTKSEPIEDEEEV